MTFTDEAPPIKSLYTHMDILFKDKSVLADSDTQLMRQTQRMPLDNWILDLVSTLTHIKTIIVAQSSLG